MPPFDHIAHAPTVRIGPRGIEAHVTTRTDSVARCRRCRAMLASDILERGVCFLCLPTRNRGRDLCQTIREVLRELGPMTNHGLWTEINCSTDSITLATRQMRKDGQIRGANGKRATVWELTDKGRSLT